MNPVDLIIKKRDGGEHSREELRALIGGIVDESLPDYQLAAWAMAVFFRGMTDAEITELTLAMAESGDTLDLHDAVPAGALIVDKHSSGGVGDKTTLAVGPIAAACGLPVGKMSGRGLSFTGGTIDKLESIRGWQAELDEPRFRRQLREIGLVVAAQTADLAPADKHLYALRDVTGTVNSLPLIAASIMSKKLAAGADAIVLDVKCGRGAFMETLDDARELARLMVAIGDGAGRAVTALITAMEQPLGRAVGNALEVAEAIATLHGNGPADFQELVEQVSAEMVVLGHRHNVDRSAALGQVQEVIRSGAALDKLRAFVAAQGGDVAQIDDPSLLPSAPVVVPVPAPVAGVVTAIDAREIGLTVVALGGGRRAKGAPIDHRVGVMCDAKVGGVVEVGAPLAWVHAADEGIAQTAVARVQAAYAIGAGRETVGSIVLERVASR
ncbi:thymidine phosphorylase [bacterium]|nr:thymidine phosphorylase [bacterium]